MIHNRGLARIRTGRKPKPYIKATSPEFLRILDEARRALDDATIGPDGKPKKRGGRPPKAKP